MPSLAFRPRRPRNPPSGCSLLLYSLQGSTLSPHSIYPRTSAFSLSSFSATHLFSFGYFSGWWGPPQHSFQQPPCSRRSAELYFWTLRGQVRPASCQLAMSPETSSTLSDAKWGPYPFLPPLSWGLNKTISVNLWWLQTLWISSGLHSPFKEVWSYPLKEQKSHSTQRSSYTTCPELLQPPCLRSTQPFLSQINLLFPLSIPWASGSLTLFPV